MLVPPPPDEWLPLDETAHALKRKRFVTAAGTGSKDEIIMKFGLNYRLKQNMSVPSWSHAGTESRERAGLVLFGNMRVRLGSSKG